MLFCHIYIFHSPPPPFSEKGEFKTGMGLDWLLNETVFQNLKHLAKLSWKSDTFSDLRLFFFFFFNFFFLIYFIYGCVGSSFLCEGSLQLCKRGPLFIAVRGPLAIAASLVAEHRLQTRRLSSCGSRTQPLRGMWDLPRPGLEPVSPALAGGFSTTAPPGKPRLFFWVEDFFPIWSLPSCYSYIEGTH